MKNHEMTLFFRNIERCRDKQKLYDALSENELKAIDYILDAHFLDKIDIKEPRFANGEPDPGGEFELVINDESYIKIGWELLVLKWANDYEITQYLIESMTT